MQRSYELASSRARKRLAVAPLGSRYRYSRRRWQWLFTVVDALGAAAAATRRFVRHGLWSAAPQWPRVPRSILLVQLDHFGDALITSAILPALRARYPQVSLEVLAGPWNRELFEACPEIDRVHVSQVNRFARHRRGFWWLATIFWGLYLRRFQYDWAIDVRGEFPLALLLWLCGAKRRIGWNCGGGGFLLTDSPPHVQGRREIEARWALLATLGIDPEPQESWPAPQFAVGRYAQSIVEHWLSDEPTARGPLIALHIGAGTRAKQWPEEHWQELLGRLVVDCDARIVLVGSEEDRAIARRITLDRTWPGVANWVGRTQVDELAALLSRADVFVGADSGPAHLAAAVSTPSVVLFSGTNDSHQWRPAGAHVTVLRHNVECSPCHRTACAWSDHPCLRQLTPEVVVAAVTRLLRPTFALHDESRGVATVSSTRTTREAVDPPTMHQEVAT